MRQSRVHETETSSLTGIPQTYIRVLKKQWFRFFTSGHFFGPYGIGWSTELGNFGTHTSYWKQSDSNLRKLLEDKNKLRFSFDKIKVLYWRAEVIKLSKCVNCIVFFRVFNFLAQSFGFLEEQKSCWEHFIEEFLGDAVQVSQIGGQYFVFNRRGHSMISSSLDLTGQQNKWSSILLVKI